MIKGPFRAGIGELTYGYLMGSGWVVYRTKDKKTSGTLKLEAVIESFGGPDEARDFITKCETMGSVEE